MIPLLQKGQVGRTILGGPAPSGDTFADLLAPNEGTGSVGDMLASMANPLTGVFGTGYVGSFALGQTLEGGTGTGQVGTPIPGLAVLLGGNGVSGHAGTLVVSRSSLLTGTYGSAVIAMRDCYFETFPSGISDFSLLRGTTNAFSATSSVLSFSGVSSSDNNSVIYKTITPRTAESISFKFQLTSIYSDDGGIFELYNGLTPIFQFNPIREGFYDPNRLAHAYVMSNDFSVSSATLSAGTWYQCDVRFTGVAGTTSFTIRKVSDDSIVYTSNLGGYTFGPYTVDRIRFFVDYANAGALSETQYKEISICSGTGITASTGDALSTNLGTASLGSFGLAQALTTVSGTGGVGTILLPSGPHLTKLQTYFDGNDSTDISYYLNGAGTIVETGTGSGITITGNKFHFYAQGTPSEGGYMEWNSAEIGGWGGPITIEWFAECISNKNLAYSRNLLYGYNSADLAGTSFEFGYQENVGYHVLEVGGTTYTYGAAAGNGRTHHAFVFGSTQRRYYIDGVLEYSSTASPPGVHPGGIIRLDGTQYNNNEITETTIDEFRIRYEEVYTGSSFTPPTNLPAPD